MSASRLASRILGHCHAVRIAPCIAIVVVGAAALHPQPAAAQEQSAPSAARILRAVALDPTTYAPAAFAYRTTVSDWNTSQVLFEHGFHELNPRFTVSGLPDDIPVSYREGRRRIAGDALLILGTSAASNAIGQTAQGLLTSRFPRHSRLIKTMGWIQRATLASYWSYRLSIQHYRQTQHNIEVARSLGYR